MSESLGATRSRTTAFGAALRSMRLAAGLSRGALAERAGLSEKAVGALERGDRTTPRPATVVLLAQAVGASPAERERLLAAARAEEQPTDTAAAPLARHGLLVPPTPLLGRQQDIAAVSQLVSPSGNAARLVTLIGPGGVGKTRVALAVAVELVDAFADDVWFVDLSPLRDYRLVAASVARALGERQVRGVGLADWECRRSHAYVDHCKEKAGQAGRPWSADGEGASARYARRLRYLRCAGCPPFVS